PIYGARPLKRVIRKHIENPLASLLLKGEVRPGETLRVDLDSHRPGELLFQKQSPSGTMETYPCEAKETSKESKVL
ncbi:MAG: hypothetical protein K2X66_05555, partial [Cyanobacteria bacterium]|nr:hypothetical protein [Cyanobacteriota bacterium]